VLERLPDALRERLFRRAFGVDKLGGSARGQEPDSR
jgi:hypothetical protein